MTAQYQLNAKAILDKQFNVDLKGYAPREVDEFLDKVIADYQTYDETIRELGESLRNYENQVEQLKAKIAELEAKAGAEGETMPPPRDYLAARQKNGKELLAVEVYERTWTWLHERGCAHLIPAQILEQYAMAISRWIQCEECITEYGFLAKHPTTGNAIPSPYVSMSQSFSKQANNLWFQIYQVVRENCSTEYKGATPHDDMMERLLSARRGG